jgi:hypothetical protein
MNADAECERSRKANATSNHLITASRHNIQIKSGAFRKHEQRFEKPEKHQAEKKIKAEYAGNEKFI